MTKKTVFYLIALAIVTVYIVLVASIRWGDDAPPRISLVQPSTQVGPTTPLSIRIEDEGTGLQEISVRLVQNLETYTLAEERFPSHGAISIEGGTQHLYELDLIPFGDDTIPKRRGPATLIISARDFSWRGFFEGNWTRFSQEFTVKFTPPQLETLSTPLPITQGGTGVIFYRTSDDAKHFGVQIGETFFPGYPTPNENHSYFSLIAFPHDLSAKTPVQLVADDGLGNKAVETVDIKVLRKKWRTRNITITDRFITRIVRPIIGHTAGLEDQGDPLRNFLAVNHDLRETNSKQLKDLGSTSQPKFMWEGVFVQLSNSQVEAFFADHRDYVYSGKVVDTQYHLGFDLAVTKHYPVEAANSGVVILAEYFGIYGNTIVIDHGYGLQSLYAHLSSFAAKKGDYVRKGQMIAKSGMTGLAGGDHLHFSVMVHGVQVNPVEWWDPDWVESRISDRLRKNEPVDPASLLPGQFPPSPFPYAPPPKF